MKKALKILVFYFIINFSHNVYSSEYDEYTFRIRSTVLMGSLHTLPLSDLPDYLKNIIIKNKEEQTTLWLESGVNLKTFKTLKPSPDMLSDPSWILDLSIIAKTYLSEILCDDYDLVDYDPGILCYLLWQSNRLGMDYELARIWDQDKVFFLEDIMCAYDEWCAQTPAYRIASLMNEIIARKLSDIREPENIIRDGTIF